MSGFNQNLLNNAFTALINGNQQVVLRDYQHAAKTFRTNSYERAPKLKFLFHTYFGINPQIFDYNSGRDLGGRNLPATNTNFGLLVKEVKLPAFSFDTTKLNQYNRKRIIQTKIRYDPIDITFHDDNGDIVNGLWESYYKYYYNDANVVGPVLQGARGGPNGSGGSKQYNDRNIYSPLVSGDDKNWGFSGGQTNSVTGKKVPFFSDITVFGFNQHNFTAYTLVNPIITAFSHDTYNYSEGGGTMTNRMSIDYETVVYNYGFMDGRDPSNIVTGFGDRANYDTHLSPIANPGSNGAALGKGGLVDSSGGSLSNAINNGVSAAIASVSASYYNAAFAPGGPNNTNNAIPRALSAFATAALRSAPINRNTPFNTPKAGSSPGPAGTAGSPDVGSVIPPDANAVTTETLAGSQYTGADLINPVGQFDITSG
jgi:hypothetical protein